MFGCWRRRTVTSVDFEERSDEVFDVVLFCESYSSFKGDPCTCYYRDGGHNDGQTGRQTGEERDREEDNLFSAKSPRSAFQPQPFLLTLTLSITSLNLLMCTLLDFSFQDPGSLRLVKVGNLEDLRCIKPVVPTTAHYDLISQLLLVHRSKRPRSLISIQRTR